MISKRNNKLCEHELGDLEHGRLYRCRICMKAVSYAKVILLCIEYNTVEPAALEIIHDKNHSWETCSDKYKILKDNSTKDFEIVKCKYCNLSGLYSNFDKNIYSINYIEKLTCININTEKHNYDY